MLQHTPAVRSRKGGRLGIDTVRDELVKLFELGSHQRFRHVVGQHFLSWTVLNLHLSSLDKICNIEILDVEMSCALSRACLSVFFELH